MELISKFQEKYSQSVSEGLSSCVQSIENMNSSELGRIFRYHLGLDDNARKQGKRIRPMITLLCVEGCGGDWRSALPAAVAIELIHNFSLIHDDIEDNSLVRRSKESVWKKWGLAKGINAGDAMFAAAFEEIYLLESTCNIDIALEAAGLLSSTCLKLTYGQQMDIDFEQREDVSIQEYYEMISGKTAALLGCCTQMGALIGKADINVRKQYAKFGYELGMAFQIYDDWLGTWGNPDTTGKSASSDLIEGKKCLPVLMGLSNSKRFCERWKRKSISQDEAILLANWLREDGVEDRVIAEYKLWNQQALGTLNQMECTVEIKRVLKELSSKLISRNK